MLWDPKILEILSASRPGANDLSPEDRAMLDAYLADNPALAAQHSQWLAFDTDLCALLQRADVPAELEARLQNAISDESDSVPVSTPVKRPSRRRFMAASAAIAASLLVGLGFYLFRDTETPWSVAQLENRAAAWTQSLKNAEWSSGELHSEFQFPSEIRVQSSRWSKLAVQDTQAKQGVVFDLTPNGATYKAWLFVLDAEVNGLPHAPPNNPVFTQGHLIASWKSGSQVCVMVIEGKEPEILKFFYRQSLHTMHSA